MPTTAWLKDGKLILDASGKVILCDVCPCNRCNCCNLDTIQNTMYVTLTFTGVGGSPCDANCETWWNANLEWTVDRLVDTFPCSWQSATRPHPCGGDASVRYNISCVAESSPGANDGSVQVDVYVWRSGINEAVGHKYWTNCSGKFNCLTDIGTVNCGNSSWFCKLQGVTFTVSSSAP